MAAVLAEHVQTDPIAVRVAFSNRMRSPDDRAVETLMQWGLACVSVGGRNQADSIRVASAETMRAHASARYDIYEVIQISNELRAAGHGETYPQFFLNYVEWVACEAPPDLTPERARDMVAETVFAVQPDHHNDSAGLYFVAASAIDTCLRLEFLADTSLMTPAEIEQVTRGIERWVLAAYLDRVPAGGPRR
jgi:hypothetical protein